MNDLTPHLGLPLPHPANDLESDVQRLRDALSMLDIAVASKAAAAEVEAALAQLLDSAPDALNSLRELAAALGDNPEFAAQVATEISTLQTRVEEILQALAMTAHADAVAEALAGKASVEAVAKKADAAGLRGTIYFMGQS